MARSRQTGTAWCASWRRLTHRSTHTASQCSHHRESLVKQRRGPQGFPNLSTTYSPNVGTGSRPASTWYSLSDYSVGPASPAARTGAEAWAMPPPCRQLPPPLRQVGRRPVPAGGRCACILRIGPARRAGCQSGWNAISCAAAKLSSRAPSHWRPSHSIPRGRPSTTAGRTAGGPGRALLKMWSAARPGSRRPCGPPSCGAAPPSTVRHDVRGRFSTTLPFSPLSGSTSSRWPASRPCPPSRRCWRGGHSPARWREATCRLVDEVKWDPTLSSISRRTPGSRRRCIQQRMKRTLNSRGGFDIPEGPCVAPSLGVGAPRPLFLHSSAHPFLPESAGFCPSLPSCGV